MPTSEEVLSLLETEGLAAFVGVSGGRGFVPRRLCIDSAAWQLHVVEAGAGAGPQAPRAPQAHAARAGAGEVPAVAFGLRGLRRVVHGIPQHPGANPPVTLEFEEEGVLPLRLAHAPLLAGFLAVLRALPRALPGEANAEVEVIERADWG